MTDDVVDVTRRTVLGMLVTAAATAAAAPLRATVASAGIANPWPTWELTSHGRHIYLTAETPPQPTDWHDARLSARLSHCSALWTETNQTYRLPQKELIERFAGDSTHPLSTRLTPGDRQRLAAAARYCHVDVTELEPYRPWFAAAVLEEAYYAASGAKGQSAARVLSAQAAKAGIPQHTEFAVKDDVFAWFGAMTPTQDVQFLRYTLDEILAGPAAAARIHTDWAAGRLERATAEVDRYSRAYPELAMLLTQRRNEAWIPRFRAMLEQVQPALVVVGLYHMVGPHGLLALAQQNGMSVQRA